MRSKSLSGTRRTENSRKSARRGVRNTKDPELELQSTPGALADRTAQEMSRGKQRDSGKT